MIHPESIFDMGNSILSLKSDCFSTRNLMIDSRTEQFREVRVIPKEVQVGHRFYRQSLSMDCDLLLKLRHPNLQKVIDVVEDDISYKVVLEHVFERSLNELIESSETQSPDGLISYLQEDVIHWALQFCDALQYLHNMNLPIEGRCIDPSKILLAQDGHVVLIDYFIHIEDVSDNKRILSLDSHHMLVSKHSSPDIRNAIFNLGLTILRLINRIKFYPTLTELLQITEKNPNLSEDERRIFLKCINIDQKKRYQTFSELSDDLAGYRHGTSYKRFGIKPFRGSKKGSTHSPVSLKDVQFTALSPMIFIKGEYTIIDIFMYEDDYKRIVTASKYCEIFSKTTTGYLRAEEGTIISVHLTSPDIEIEDNVETLTWYGKYLRFRFFVYVPKDCNKKQLRFNACIYFNTVIACKLKFISECSFPDRKELIIDRTDYLSAFISYASPDRNRVISIVQGMRKMRPDLDIFFDIDYLRSGDQWESVLKKEIIKRDVLFLCWSQFAKSSAWVDMEWRYALKHKGIEAIEPIPLESPLKCPPPKELEMKHFNDRELYYIIDES